MKLMLGLCKDVRDPVVRGCTDSRAGNNIKEKGRNGIKQRKGGDYRG